MVVGGVVFELGLMGSKCTLFDFVVEVTDTALNRAWYSVSLTNIDPYQCNWQGLWNLCRSINALDGVWSAFEGGLGQNIDAKRAAMTHVLALLL